MERSKNLEVKRRDFSGEGLAEVAPALAHAYISPVSLGQGVKGVPSFPKYLSRAFALAALAAALAALAAAEKLVIVEARGVGSTAGQVIDSKQHLSLLVGEHVRLIGENGNQYCIDGPYDGPALPAAKARVAPNLVSRLIGSGVHASDPLTDCLQ